MPCGRHDRRTSQCPRVSRSGRPTRHRSTSNISGASFFVDPRDGSDPVARGSPLTQQCFDHRDADGEILPVGAASITTRPVSACGTASRWTSVFRRCRRPRGCPACAWKEAPRQSRLRTCWRIALRACSSLAARAQSDSPLATAQLPPPTALAAGTAVPRKLLARKPRNTDIIVGGRSVDEPVSSVQTHDRTATS
jgi:hypothetical protein